MKTLDYSKMASLVTGVNEKLSPVLADYKYRGFISSELRITPDGKAYAIDPCARMGSPPGELFQLMFTNLAEILWEGADGKLVDPEFAAPWGAEVLLHSQWADQNWQALSFPEKIRKNIKLRNHTIIEGKDYVVPQSVGLPEVGAVCALGNSMDEAIKNCLEMAEQVKGYCIQVHKDAFDEVQEEIAELAEYGIDFLGSEDAGSLRRRTEAA